MSFRDTYTEFRSRERLSKHAGQWRNARRDKTYAFNVPHFFSDVLVPRTRDQLNIDLQLLDSGLESRLPAEVDFSRLSTEGVTTLRVGRKLWNGALDNKPFPRFVIAHEIAHLVLHSHGVHAFSSSSAERMKFAQPEYWTEWQANTWASHFLISDEDVIKHAIIYKSDAPDAIENIYSVPYEEALARIELLHKQIRSAKQRYSGEACHDCGNFTMVLNGTHLKCDICGGSAECI